MGFLNRNKKADSNDDDVDVDGGRRYVGSDPDGYGVGAPYSSSPSMGQQHHQERRYDDPQLVQPSNAVANAEEVSNDYQQYNPSSSYDNNNNNNNDGNSNSNNNNRSSFRRAGVDSGNGNDHRGFATSINDMFNDPKYEREDCCSITCCGVLQADRNRYLITGIPAPSCWKRVGSHCFSPCLLLAWAMVCAVSIPDTFLNQLLSTGFVLVLIAYFVIQCCKGSAKRREARKNLLWSKHHLLQTRRFQHYRRNDDNDEDSISNASENTENLQYLMGQTVSDMRNAHLLCGLYANDQPSGDDGDGEANTNKDDNKIKYYCCSNFFRWYSKCCCGYLCKRQLQVCGMCAVGQETRELEILLPEGMKQIDYITMQPIMDYYPLIYKDRHHDGRLGKDWWSRLSELSRLIIYSIGGVFAFLLVWSLLAPIIRLRFRFTNFLVFCATFLQAVGFLAIVHWNHTLDVSVDALIKYFASGFCLSTSLAVFFEIVAGLVVRLMMNGLLAMTGIKTVEENGYSMTSSLSSSGGVGRLLANLLEGATTTGDAQLSASVTYRQYMKAWGHDHPVLYSIYLLITSFLLAALIEELCKYFGYRMVDHPDFYSQQKLESAAADLQYRKQPTNSSNPEQQQQEQQLYEHQDFSQQHSSLKSKGAATTVAMIATALGFACCENLVYVFIYGGSNMAGSQMLVLLARSILPVHPIAAAIQSVRVVQRDMEKDDRMARVGKIVYPSVIFHGIYDFMTMLIDFLYERKGKQNAGLTNCLVSVSILLIGCWYYMRRALPQRKRLEELDRSESVDGSRLI